VFKRLFWLTIGVVAGFTGSVWLQKRVKQTVDRFAPRFAPESVQADVKAAVQEGRSAMRAREDELRTRYSPHAPRQSPNGRSRAHR
jgi:hypothetical protein